MKFVLEKYTEYVENEVNNTREDLLKQGEEDSAEFLASLEKEDKKYVSHTVDVKDNEDGIIYNTIYVIDEEIGEFVELGE